MPVSVALPRWRDVIAYEEKDPACRDALQTIYPRFGLHPLIQQLVQPSELAGTTVWPYPTEAAAQAAPGPLPTQGTGEPLGM